MELSQDFLIDMALNVGGYLFAGVFSVVVYSIFRRRPRAETCTEVTPVATEEPEKEPAETVPTPNRRIEFVKLGRRAEQPATSASAREGTNTESTSDRRNRSETIRIARTMLKAGASHDKIKRLLPISDAELSLLTMSKS